MALTVVTTNTEYYADSTIGKPVSLGSVYVGKPDLDPEVEANRLAVVVRQENGTDVNISPAQQPLQTGAGGIVQYQGANVQLLVEGNYSIKVLRQNGTQAYYISNVLNGVPADRAETIVRYANIAALRATGISTDITVWVDGHTTFQDGGQGLFNFNSSSVATDDNGVTIKLDSTTVGRYIRSIPQSFSVGFYGLKTDGSDNAVAFLAAKAATAQSKYIPPGSYSVLSGDFSSDLFWSDGVVTISGNTTINVSTVGSGSHVRMDHVEASGVSGGDSVSSVWNVRELNQVEYDVSKLVTLDVTTNVGRFLLQPGSYKGRANSVSYRSDASIVRLRNIDDGLFYYGESVFIDSSLLASTAANVYFEFTITSAKNFQLEHYIQSSFPSTGLGRPNSASVENRYGSITLTRISLV